MEDADMCSTRDFPNKCKIGTLKCLSDTTNESVNTFITIKRAALEVLPTVQSIEDMIKLRNLLKCLICMKQEAYKTEGIFRYNGNLCDLLERYVAAECRYLEGKSEEEQSSGQKYMHKLLEISLADVERDKRLLLIFSIVAKAAETIKGDRQFANNYIKCLLESVKMVEDVNSLWEDNTTNCGSLIWDNSKLKKLDAFDRLALVDADRDSDRDSDIKDSDNEESLSEEQLYQQLFPSREKLRNLKTETSASTLPKSNTFIRSKNLGKSPISTIFKSSNSNSLKTAQHHMPEDNGSVVDAEEYPATTIKTSAKIIGNFKGKNGGWKQSPRLIPNPIKIKPKRREQIETENVMINLVGETSDNVTVSPNVPATIDCSSPVMMETNVDGPLAIVSIEPDEPEKVIEPSVDQMDDSVTKSHKPSEPEPTLTPKSPENPTLTLRSPDKPSITPKSPENTVEVLEDPEIIEMVSSSEIVKPSSTIDESKLPITNTLIIDTPEIELCSTEHAENNEPVIGNLDVSVKNVDNVLPIAKLSPHLTQVAQRLNERVKDHSPTKINVSCEESMIGDSSVHEDFDDKMDDDVSVPIELENISVPAETECAEKSAVSIDETNEDDDSLVSSPSKNPTAHRIADILGSPKKTDDITDLDLQLESLKLRTKGERKSFHGPKVANDADAEKETSPVTVDANPITETNTLDSSDVIESIPVDSALEIAGISPISSNSITFSDAENADNDVKSDDCIRSESVSSNKSHKERDSKDRVKKKSSKKKHKSEHSSSETENKKSGRVKDKKPSTIKSTNRTKKISSPNISSKEYVEHLTKTLFMPDTRNIVLNKTDVSKSSDSKSSARDVQRDNNVKPKSCSQEKRKLKCDQSQTEASKSKKHIVISKRQTKTESKNKMQKSIEFISGKTRRLSMNSTETHLDPHLGPNTTNVDTISMSMIPDTDYSTKANSDHIAKLVNPTTCLQRKPSISHEYHPDLPKPREDSTTMEKKASSHVTTYVIKGKAAFNEPFFGDSSAKNEDKDEEAILLKYKHNSSDHQIDEFYSSCEFIKPEPSTDGENGESLFDDVMDFGPGPDTIDCDPCPAFTLQSAIKGLEALKNLTSTSGKQYSPKNSNQDRINVVDINMLKDDAFLDNIGPSDVVTRDGMSPVAPSFDLTKFATTQILDVVKKQRQETFPQPFHGVDLEKPEFPKMRGEGPLLISEAQVSDMKASQNCDVEINNVEEPTPVKVVPVQQTSPKQSRKQRKVPELPKKSENSANTSAILETLMKRAKTKTAFRPRKKETVLVSTPSKIDDVSAKTTPSASEDPFDRMVSTEPPWIEKMNTRYPGLLHSKTKQNNT